MNYQNRTKEELIIELQELQQRYNAVLDSLDKVNSDRAQFKKDLLREKKEADKNENHFQKLFENMEQGFALHRIICDSNNKPIDYRFIKVNTAFEKLTGLKADNIIGKTVKEVLPKTEDIWIKNYGKVALTGNSIEFENHSSELDKYYHVVAYSPEKDFFATVFFDVTVRKRKEINLVRDKEGAEEREEKLKFQSILIDNINDFITATDMQGNIVYVNQKEKDVFKINDIDNNYFNVKDFGEDATEGATQQSIIECTLKFGNWRGEVVNYTPNGEKIYLDCRTQLLKDQDGKPYCMVGISTDITLRKKHELELTKTNEALLTAKEKAEESDRLKTAFLQNMSHEIRTPLNAILGFSGMLNSLEISEDQRKSFVAIIQNSSDQLISIVNDILTISSLETKQEKANINEVCINNVIVELLFIFKQQIKNHKISINAIQQLSDKQSEIYTDRTKIIQILNNLLSNALKFTNEGFIEFGYRLKGNELEFYVNDSGIGIKPEYHKIIFERFRQANSTENKIYGGTGLGLSISKGFVELLGGRIWVQSELGKGSEFLFTIPYNPVN
jgi:PAS domain S-box-containing protein